MRRDTEWLGNLEHFRSFGTQFCHIQILRDSFLVFFFPTSLSIQHRSDLAAGNLRIVFGKFSSLDSLSTDSLICYSTLCLLLPKLLSSRFSSSIVSSTSKTMFRTSILFDSSIATLKTFLETDHHSIETLRLFIKDLKLALENLRALQSGVILPNTPH